MADGIPRNSPAPLGPVAEDDRAAAVILPAPLPLPATIRHQRLGTPSATWHYRDAAGGLLFAVCRFDPPRDRKQILPLTCDGSGWRWCAPPAPRPLYGLDRLAARPDATVLVVEGEKTAEAAATTFTDYVSITWPGGAQAVGKADWQPLRGRRVVVWPDNDEAGRKAAAAGVKACREADAASVAVVQVPSDWPDGWDLADALPAGVTINTLRALAAEAPPEAADTPAESLKDRIARLAKLSPIEYDRVREEEARALGVRMTTLDEEVDKARGKPAATHGRSVALPELEPWPHPVSGGELLDDLASAVRRHVVLPDAATVAVAGWIAHTYVFERFQHTPRLAITSPTKRCGKSTLLEVLRATCNRPVKADNISASGTFRTVEALAPVTLLIDEADTFLGQNEELRGILNSGFERGGEVIRVVEIRDEHQPIRFRTFAACALACIGHLPGTLEDRSIPVALQRRAVTEAVVKLRTPGARAALHDLARRCARWAADRGRHLNPDPAVPEQLGDREGDLAVPLLAIADDAGGPWPERMRRALMALFSKRAADDGAADLAIMLLADIREVFARTKLDRLSSGQILSDLWGMKERPWPEFRHGKPLNAAQLARLLRPFEIRPGTIRVGEHETPKGYLREAFVAAWQRYLPPEDTSSALEGASEPPQRHNVGKSRLSGEFGAATQGQTVAPQNSRKPAENGHGGGVADRNPSCGVKGNSAPGWRAVL